MRYDDSLTVEDYQTVQEQMVPLDWAERMTTGVPTDKEAPIWIELWNKVLAAQRFKDWGGSHRLDWLTYSNNGKDVDAFIAAAQTCRELVFSKIPYAIPLSIDQAENIGPALSLAQVQKVSGALKAQGWPGWAWGAYGNADTIEYANFGMLGCDPKTILPISAKQKVPAFTKAKYHQPICFHLDEPTIFKEFEQDYPKLQEQLDAFTLGFQNQVQVIDGVKYFLPFRIPIYQNGIYDYRANLAFFSDSFKKYNP
jgi:hypothetical protein